MNRDFIYTGIAWTGFIMILSVLPWLVPPEPDLPNTASMQGYNISLAYLLTAGWTLVVAFLSLTQDTKVSLPEAPPSAIGPRTSVRWIEKLIVGGAIAVFYWPAALARFGPHVEDTYFLATAWRMICGEAPYTDFEFLYGPAMIHIPGWWLAVSGFSMQGYYTVLMVLQVTLFITLVSILQRYIVWFRARLLTFLVLLPFFLDILLGLNWIPWRYFFAVLVILTLARNPRTGSTALLAGTIIGLGAAFSYEYGIAALLSGVAILLATLFEPNRRPTVINLIILPFVSITVWALTAFAMTGSDFFEYLSSTQHIAETASALGLGQFAFGWTVHSLALFFLLAGLAVIGGQGLRKLGRKTASEGDLQLIGAAVFAVVVLKIAFQRTDHLHLIVPFIPLILMLLLQQPRRLMTASPSLRTAMLCAVVVASLAHAVGNVPLGRWVVFGTARGLLHEITDRPTVGKIDSRRPSVHSERSEPKSRTVKLAARLNAPDLRNRPVLFYGGIWNLGIETGVCPVGYSFYDLLYSDQRFPLADTARTTNDLLIVMRERDYDQLFNGIEPVPGKRGLNLMERIGGVISSVHFTETRLETHIEYDQWKRRLGDELTSTYQLKERFADFAILEQIR